MRSEKDLFQVMRSEKDLFQALALKAAGVQLDLQKDRTYSEDKHFLMTVEEFVENFCYMVKTTNVGWYGFRGFPVWIGNINSE